VNTTFVIGTLGSPDVNVVVVPAFIADQYNDALIKPEPLIPPDPPAPLVDVVVCLAWLFR